MSKRIKIAWADEPADDDYAAAETYLSLMIAPRRAAGVVRRLRKAPVQSFLARDLLRAAGISPLGTNPSDEQRQKILAKEPLAPILLVRSDREMRLIVADGYHRLSTVYAFDEAAAVPSKLADLDSKDAGR